MDRAKKWLKSLFGIKNSSSDLERRRFGARTDGLCGNPETIPPNISASEAAWLRTYCEAALAETEKEQSRQATAAATAAAAYAAVAAAKAAAVVVRLTCKRDGEVFGGERRKWRLAALKIQCAFRSYLARKALRALRGVVKIQALVRGYLVRKQAAATLRSMQAILRAQSAAKLHRARKSTEKFEDETFSNNSRRFSASFVTGIKNSCEEIAAKIVEIDTGEYRLGPSRIRKPAASSGSDLTDDIFQYRSFSSPLSGRIPGRLSIPKPELDEYLTSKKFPTAQSTPRRLVSSPSKSVSAGGGGFFQDCNPKNYMADTTSFRAKLRWQSAPRQRPEKAADAAYGRRRRRTEDVAAADESWRRSVCGGARTGSPSSSGVREGMSFKEAVVGKLV